MREYRKVDDTVIMRLNRTGAQFRDRDRAMVNPSLRGSPEEDACAYFWRDLIMNWKRRTEIIQYCVGVMDNGIDGKQKAIATENLSSEEQSRIKNASSTEEVKRSQIHNELAVEAIVRQRSLDEPLSLQPSGIAPSIMRLLTTIILAMFAPSLLTLPALAAASTYARLMLQFPSYMPGQNAFAGGEFTSAPEDDEVKVPVTLGVMSRCPDALLCETVFDKVLPQVNDRINLTLSFIGQIDASEPDFGVTCLHGPLECAGNVHELCASNHLDQKQWWSYLKCLNFNGRGKIGEPETALKCAETAKFDWTESGVGDCAGQDGSGKAEEGISLLQESDS
ncbi:hypothetical protein EW145_g318 [Phellinidium pouzarii]|uniref:Gamma interferon inducible lysosomal thiol reductase GILT n=1 Tax=Phellinidium pouzarii TaxID=167371 RepID=A0A4S4LJD7_9AGAM|nr:hypothetical protein EW145_g318 [Phellinidium pouzarii]